MLGLDHDRDRVPLACAGRLVLEQIGRPGRSEPGIVVWSDGRDAGRASRPARTGCDAGSQKAAGETAQSRVPAAVSLRGARAGPSSDPWASQSAIRPPISSPASSWRKCEAFSILLGRGRRRSGRERLPTLNGSTGSESAHRTSVGRASPRAPRAPACRPPRPASRGRSAASAGRRARRPSTPGSGTARRRRRRPRRPCRGRSAFRTSIAIGRSSVRSTKSRNACQASDIGCSPGEQAGVHDDDPRDPVGVLDGDSAGRSARPSRGRRRSRRAGRGRSSSVGGELGVAVVGVPVEVGGLVGAAEAGVVGCDAAIAGVGTGGITLRQRYDQSARRGRTRPAGPSPSSTWASRRPSTSR